MKKFVKIFAISMIFVAILGISALGFYLGSNLLKFSTLALDVNALTKNSLSIKILDKNGQEIDQENTFETKYVRLREMPPYAYNAFISIEDKDFYKHNGLNYKRIAGAMIKNLKTMSFKEGASTISQQLIKNTHLSSEKTIERKMKEIVLTRKLEKTMTKEEILESYLNIIYFGNDCYGLASASEYYFSKPCKDLNLSESALLAGMIKSPNKYSPILHPEKAKNRRNLVLDEMFKDGKISEEELMRSKSLEIDLNLNSKNENKLNSYSEATIDEAKNLLHLPAKQIALAGYTIHTYQDKESQEKLENSLNSVDLDGADHAGLVVDAKTHGVSAFVGKSAYKILESKRQPGSCIKPLLVFAPAINEDIISPETQILDEKLKIAEYSPENVNGKYSGYVSAKEALAKSINIPAVKVLSYVGTEKAKSYCEEMNIHFDKNDTSYALALGGMTYGVNLKDLATAYSTFCNDGEFAESRFINFITNKEGKIIYQHKPVTKRVFRKDASYLLTEMLKYTAKEGTAKKLAELGIDIASKTGTVGKPGSKQNLDAWNISYTKSKVCAVWVGNLDNTPINIAGGNQPTEIAKKFFKGEKNEEFERPNEVVTREIDLVDLEENHRLTLANSDTPSRFKKEALFSVFNLPNASENFTTLPEIDAKISSEGGKNVLILNAKKFMTYQIFDSSGKLLFSISDKNETLSFPIYSQEVKVVAKFLGSNFENKKIFKLAKKSSQPKNWWEV